jgi:hypothetical protein
MSERERSERHRSKALGLEHRVEVAGERARGTFPVSDEYGTVGLDDRQGVLRLMIARRVR